MALTAEQREAIIKVHGEGALPKEEIPAPDTETPDTPKEEEVTKKEPVIANDAPVVTAPELDDAAVLAFLKKKNIQVNSFEELVPKEDPTVVAEKRENEILAYGLQKGKFSKKEYESYVRDAADLQNVVYRDYYEDAKKGDPDLTDEDIQAEFAAKYGLDGEKDSRKYKRGIQEMAIMADKILKTKHSKILSVEHEYDKTVNEGKEQQSYQQRIVQATPAYKKDVEDIFTALKKTSIKLGDDEFEVAHDDEVINTLKADFLSPERLENHISAGFTKEQLTQIAEIALKSQTYNSAIEKVSKQYLLKHQAGTKGIVPQQGSFQKPGETALTDDQKKALVFTHGPDAIAN